MNICVVNLELPRLHNKNNSNTNDKWICMKNHMRIYWEDAVLIVGAVSETVLYSVIYGDIVVLCWTLAVQTAHCDLQIGGSLWQHACMIKNDAS